MIKRYLYKLFLFLIPVLLVLLAVEMMYRFAPNTYSVKNQIIADNSNAETVIFGNSHAYYGLNPDFFDQRTINVSNVSQSLYFDRLIFEDKISRFDNLDHIILCIDYFTLSMVDNTDEDRWRKFYYKAYMDLDVPAISVFEPGAYFLSSTRSFNFNVGLAKKYVEQGTLADCNKTGFGTAYTKQNRLKNLNVIASQIAKKHEDHLTDFSINTARIQDIIHKCNALKVEVIIVTMPVCKEYGRKVNQVKLKKIITACELFQSQNKNVRYLNLFRDSRFTDDDFYDADHLHNEGAKKCSEIVNSFINKP